MGIISFILSLITIGLLFNPNTFLFASITAIIALILGIIAIKKKQKIFPILAVIISSLSLIMFIILSIIFGISYSATKYVQVSHYSKDNERVSAPPPAPLRTFELKDFVAQTIGKNPHIIKMKMSLGYENSKELKNELFNRRNQIRHIIKLSIQGKKIEELQEVSKQIMLAEKIKSAVNKLLVNGKIKDIYFKDIVLKKK